ncbi:MAG: hypothetical protein HY264_01465 [Chloroflexi bacterium]|nr:hypothetical protein [Chloroflexota bacterium]
MNDEPLASAVIYDPAKNSFSATGSMGAARALFTATTLADGRVLVTGGGPATWSKPGPLLASAELYDPRTGSFTPTGSMATPREGHSATLLPDGRVLIAGGIDTSGGSHAVASAELYDPKTGKFSPAAPMADARSFHTATMLADGRALVAGGDPAGWAATGQILASAEIYDPGTGKFTTTGSMAGPRGDHSATLLADGRVLLTGGENGNGTIGSAELYDPKAGTFGSTSSMTVVRVWQTATLLAGGRVLIAGGGGNYSNREFLDSAELFDPATGTFTKTGSMAEQRTYQTSTLLTDGRVLIAGGYGNLAPLANAELYDPTTGTFSPAG